jgi:probable F420-dependent oxidoreductase
VKFGILGANAGRLATPEGARAIATTAERLGFESLWTFEHVIAPLGYASSYPYAADGKAPGLETSPLPDPLGWLCYVAAVTRTIRLGTGILILPQRNPIVLAKEVATLDHLSGGRAELGVGVGWLEEEFDALGVPFAGRGARTDEAIEVLRALWADDDASHTGQLWSFSRVSCLPRPAAGRVPVHIGGHSEVAARRAGRVGDGFFPALDAASIEQLGFPRAVERVLDLMDLTRRTAEDHDRDPDAIELTITTGIAPSADVVEQLAEAGCHRILVLTPTRNPARLADRLGDVAGELGLQP